jgi:DNA-binding protein YbaB
MSGPLVNHIEQRLAEFERRRSALADVQTEVNQTRATVESKSRAIAVTVDSRGELVDITFRGNGFRSMAGPELAQLIVETVRTARSEVMDTVAAMFGPALPPGLPLREMMNGKVNFDTMMRDAARWADGVAETLSAKALPEREGGE